MRIKKTAPNLEPSFSACQKSLKRQDTEQKPHQLRNTIFIKLNTRKLHFPGDLLVNLDQIFFRCWVVVWVTQHGILQGSLQLITAGLERQEGDTSTYHTTNNRNCFFKEAGKNFFCHFYTEPFCHIFYDRIDRSLGKRTTKQPFFHAGGQSLCHSM